MCPQRSLIRVAIVGLGRGSGDFGPGLWAAQAHLPYLMTSPHFIITAICNSSVTSAQASIDYYKIGTNVKAYGDVTDLAKDTSVDVVLISVRVTNHYALTKPLLEAKKDVFVEWPLAANIPQAEELTALATKNNIKTLVGLQSLASPVVQKLQSLISSRQIGEVLSSVVTASFFGFPTNIFPADADYYLDANSGGNSLTIFFGHFLSSFLYVLGPFSKEEKDINTIFDTKFPDMQLVDMTTGTPGAQIKRTAPDHIFVQGKLESGALASLSYRSVPKGVEDVALKWTITGTEGEIIVETKSGQWQMLREEEISVKVKSGEGEVEVVGLGGEGKGKGKGFNTGRLWGSLVDGDGVEAEYVSFEGALEMQRVLGRIREMAGL